MNELMVVMMAVLWAFRAFICAFYVNWESVLFSLVECFFSFFMTSLYIFEAICIMTNIASFENDYHNIFGVLVFLIQLCIAKWILSGLSLNIPSKANEGIRILKDATYACSSKGKEFTGTIITFICSHRHTCVKVECLCRDSDIENVKDDSNIILPNSNVLNTKENIPKMYKEGFFIKALKILTDDISSQFPVNDELEILVAELNFYYFGNHYYALEKLWPIIGRNPNILMKQRIYNLKRNISQGLERNYAMTVDREKVVVSIDYLESYRLFLDKSEDLIEFTVKFWSHLLQEHPTSRELNKIGNRLFKTKQDILLIVKKLSNFTMNSFDFLLRYGLLLKSVMHDHLAANQIFNKLVYLNSSVHSFSENSRFSIFSNKSAVMFLVASFTENDDANIIQFNTEFEKCTGYKYQEIIGHSITTLMPSVIANMHSKFIQKFFQTMESKILGVPVSVFIKCKNSLYIPCRILVKMVPHMLNSLQAAVFIVKDTKMTPYTMFNSNKKLNLNNKYGAIVSDASNSKIIGMTKEAINILKLDVNNMSEMSKSSAFEDLFPNLLNESVKNLLTQKEGLIIKRTFCGFDEENNPKTQEISDSKSVFLWARLITETYTEQAKLSILVISEINKKHVNLLIPHPENNSLYRVLSETNTLNEYDNLLSKSHANLPSHKTNNEKHIDSESVRFLSPEENGSSCSASSDSRSLATDIDTEGLNNKLHQDEFVDQIPSSIKCLSFGIGLALLGIISLICIFI